MAIPTTDLDIGTRYALQEDFNNGFVGRDRQVVIQIDDPKGYRPVIMDGTTTGGKNKVALVDDLSDYVPVDTYNSEKAGFATKGELSSYETTTHASATYETKANAQATYATKTELGNKADSSALANYATKTELGNKADSSALANYATKTELASKAPLANPALTGTATLNGQTIATVDQIPSVPTLTASQTDLEAGVSELATGTFYFVYE